MTECSVNVKMIMMMMMRMMILGALHIDKRDSETECIVR